MTESFLNRHIIKLIGISILSVIIFFFTNKENFRVESVSRSPLIGMVVPKTYRIHLISEERDIKLEGNVTEYSQHLTASKIALKKFKKSVKAYDQAFLSLNRFEQPILDKERSKIKTKTFGDILRTLFPEQEKKLIFSGEGFETQDFEMNVDEKLIVDYHYHINFDDRKTVTIAPEISLDPNELNLNAPRTLIFHRAITLMNAPNKVELLPTFKKNRQVNLLPSTLTPILETKVLLHEHPKYLLKLRPGKQVIDLLDLKEEWNRARFYGSE